MSETLLNGSDHEPATASGLIIPGLPASPSRRGRKPSRRDFLTVSGAVAAMAVVGCGDDDDDDGGPVLTLPLQNDTDILNFALFLELLEAEFYSQAVGSSALTDANVQALAQSVRDNEQEHVDFLQGALGDAAIDDGRVEFDFGTSFDNQTNFLNTAVILEQTGVGAYLGAIGLIANRATRVAAGSIFTVEARHNAAFRAYANSMGGPVPVAFETPVAADAVVAAVRATGFVVRGL